MPVERRHEMGAGGTCVCPKCEAHLPHRRDIPCQEEKCPGCGTKMLRVGSEHYRLWVAKRQAQEARERTAESD